MTYEGPRGFAMPAVHEDGVIEWCWLDYLVSWLWHQSYQAHPRTEVEAMRPLWLELDTLVTLAYEHHGLQATLSWTQLWPDDVPFHHIGRHRPDCLLAKFWHWVPVVSAIVTEWFEEAS